MSRFSLASEQWIPVRLKDGTVTSVGFLDLFRQAEEIEVILGDLPTQTFALLRVALSILGRVVDGPPSEEDWEELWEADSLPTDRIEAYLKEWEHAFDLFGPNAFMQTPGLETAKGETSPISKIIADVPDGYAYFTVRSGAGLDQISAAEAARWLIHAHAFDPSGIKSGAVDDPRVKGGKGYPIGTGWAGNLGGLYWEAESLRQTLLLNLIPRDFQEILEWTPEDRPAWEAPNQTGAEATDVHFRPYGPWDLLTWQARRIRLIGDAHGVTGVLVCNGDKLEPFNKFRNEPMTAWRLSKPQAKKRGLAQAYMPQQHDPAKALWRGLESLLPVAAPASASGRAHMTAGIVEWVRQALPEDQRFTLRAVGVVYGTQNSMILDLYEDRLTIPTALLSDLHPELAWTVLNAVEQTERHGVWALRNLASNLARAAGADTEELIKGRSDRAAERAYAALDPVFRSWLAELKSESDPAGARSAYNGAARGVLLALGRELAATASPQSIVGRLVRTGGRDSTPRRITAPVAEAWFRAAIWKAFPNEDSEGGEE